MPKKLTPQQLLTVLNVHKPNKTPWIITDTMNNTAFDLRKKIVTKDKKKFIYNRYAFLGKNFNVNKMRNINDDVEIGSTLDYMEELERGGTYSNKTEKGTNKAIPTTFAKRSKNGKVKAKFNLKNKRPKKIDVRKVSNEKSKVAAFINQAKKKKGDMFYGTLNNKRGIYSVKGGLNMVYNTSTVQKKQPKMSWMHKALKSHVKDFVIYNFYKKNIVRQLRKIGY